MRTLWAYLDKKNWQAQTKFKCASWILGIMGAFIGFLLWYVILSRFLPGIEWLLFFVMFPVILSWFIAFFYSCRNDFHDGCKK